MRSAEAAAAPHVYLFMFFKTLSFQLNVTLVGFRVGRFDKLKQMTTSNGGSLGSCIDEERSQLR